MIVRIRAVAGGGTTPIGKVGAELLRSRIHSGFRGGRFGFGDAPHDSGRIVIGAHFRSLRLDRRETARACLRVLRAALLLPLQHATPANSAHGIQQARERKNERQGNRKGKVHNLRVCLAAPAWRKSRLTWRRRTATGGGCPVRHVCPPTTAGAKSPSHNVGRDLSPTPCSRPFLGCARCHRWS